MKLCMKTPIGCRALRCDKDQFRANEYLNRLPDIVLENRGLNKKQRKKKRKEGEKYETWHFHYRTLAFSCLPRGFWPFMSLVDHKGTQRGSLDA